MPHKILFYLGFTVVLLFLGLSYWQFTSYKEDSTIINDINDKNTDLPLNIYVKDLYSPQKNGLTQYSYVRLMHKFSLTDKKEFINSWYLRSRVHNGENGYHLVTLYRVSSTEKYFLINHGWVPLDFDKDSINHSRINSFFEGRLLEYDVQGIGQDDIFGSQYLFRIDKKFIEREFSIKYPNIKLPDYYIVLTDFCTLECVNLIKPYDAPHLSYAFQWIFFGLTLSVVILRKNKLI